ncbi:MAG TPA: energy transducer TonB [Cyclobacteriaceae bacterium]|nr:energy transducer TonB [Cyclobacteriaceae bacterium]HRJ83022.1 energy transducer TonB [Cyclobacteriaceae bacterium]
MEPKKNPAKDVHRFSKHFFMMGICLSTVMVITAFEWRSRIQSPTPPPDLPGELIYTSAEMPLVFIESTEIPKRKEVKVIDLNKIEVAETETVAADDILIETIYEAPIRSVQLDIPLEDPIDTFFIVEKMPVPIGGFDSFYRNLAKSVNYPAPAKRSGTEGKVFVEFVVNEYGEAVNFKIVKGIGSGCDEEAIRVLKLVRWEPGKQRGKPVAVRKVLPIYFKLK